MKLPFVPYDHDTAFWQTRRRLPHREQAGCTYFVTWRLADSVPSDLLKLWKAEREVFIQAHPKPWDEETCREHSQRFEHGLERWSDEGHGACHFRRADLREIICSAFHHFDQQRYDLVSYVVMPNHVHVLVRPYAGTPAESAADIPVCTSVSVPGHGKPGSGSSSPYPLLHPSSLAGILKAWKGFTSRELNCALGRSGTLWMDESFDHAVRSEAQLRKFRDYIRDNAADAGLQEGEATSWEAR